jgi:hypothetical protein
MSIFTADRDLNKLTPEMKKRVQKFLKECADAGTPVFITEGFRTTARQKWLYSFGRYGENKSKGKVTWTLESNHMTGEAVDIAFDKAGDIYVGQWEKVYDIAEKNGLRSLYRDSGYDRPHLNFDHNWTPPFNRRVHEKKLIDLGIVTTEKDLDLPPTREEFYKIASLLHESQEKRIEALEKDNRTLKRKLIRLENLIKRIQ